MGKPFMFLLFSFSFSSLAVGLAEPCGKLAGGEPCGTQHGGALCPYGECCSQYGYCGITTDYCGDGCQSQCKVSLLINQTLFEEMLKNRSAPGCDGGFYTYDAFIAAANSFSDFATSGNSTMRKREVAAFLAQTSHETIDKNATAPDEPFTGGYCIVEQQDHHGNYCVPSTETEWPCVLGKEYYGRGPIQLTYNYNYGLAGENISEHLLANPDLVATNPRISFETALWFWMTPQPPKPSCHDVITGKWSPTAEDIEANRLPGYGTITNIFNGAVECGHAHDDNQIDRIGFYKRYCELFEISYGDNLDCYHQAPFDPEGHSAS